MAATAEGGIAGNKADFAVNFGRADERRNIRQIRTFGIGERSAVGEFSLQVAAR